MKSSGIGRRLHGARWRLRPEARISRLLVAAAGACVTLAVLPQHSDAQLSAPCETRCTLVLSASSYAIATGATVGLARLRGGLSSGGDAAWIWAGGFAAAFGAGLALGQNGERQERAVYGSGLGTLVGALGGLVVGSRRSEGDAPHRLGAVLIGVGAGALVGGVVGALTHDGRSGSARPIPFLVSRISF